MYFLLWKVETAFTHTYHLNYSRVVIINWITNTPTLEFPYFFFLYYYISSMLYDSIGKGLPFLIFSLLSFSMSSLIISPSQFLLTVFINLPFCFNSIFHGFSSSLSLSSPRQKKRKRWRRKNKWFHICMKKRTINMIIFVSCVRHHKSIMYVLFVCDIGGILSPKRAWLNFCFGIFLFTFLFFYILILLDNNLFSIKKFPVWIHSVEI